MAKYVPIIINVSGNAQGAVQQLTNAMQQMQQQAQQAQQQMAAGQAAARAAAQQQKQAMQEAMLAAQLYYNIIKEGISWIRSITSETILYAARTEELGVAQHALAKVNGISTTAIDAQEKAMKSLNITTQDTRQTLSKFMVAQLDVSRASDLAVAAQNLAVVAGVSTQEELERLTHGIVTMQPRVLRTAGVFITVKEVTDAYARSVGKAASQLTEQEKQQAVLNRVIEYGARVTGLYDAAMETAAKRMRSLQRVQEEFYNSFGSLFLNGFNTGIHVAETFLTVLGRYPETLYAIIRYLVLLGVTWVAINTTVLVTLKANLIALAGSLVNVGAAMIGVRTAAMATATGLQMGVTAIAGWLTVIALIVAAGTALYEYSKNSQKMIELDAKVSSTLLNQASGLQKQMDYFRENQDAVVKDGDAKSRLREIEDQLGIAAKVQIESLTDAKQKYEALDKAVAAYAKRLQDDLRPQAQLAGENAVRSLREQVMAMDQLAAKEKELSGFKTGSYLSGWRSIGNLVPESIRKGAARDLAEQSGKEYDELLKKAHDSEVSAEYINDIKLLAQIGHQYKQNADQVLAYYQIHLDPKYADRVRENINKEIELIDILANKWKSAEQYLTAYGEAMSNIKIKPTNFDVGEEYATKIASALETNLTFARANGFKDLTIYHQQKDLIKQVDDALANLSGTQQEYNGWVKKQNPIVQEFLKLYGKFREAEGGIQTYTKEGNEDYKRRHELLMKIARAQENIAAFRSGKSPDDSEELRAAVLKRTEDKMRELYLMRESLGIAASPMKSDIPSLDRELFLNHQIEAGKKNVEKLTYAQREAEIQLAEAVKSTWIKVVDAETRSAKQFVDFVNQQRNAEQQLTADITVELEKRAYNAMHLNERVAQAQANVFKDSLENQAKAEDEFFKNMAEKQMLAGGFKDNPFINSAQTGSTNTVTALVNKTNEILSKDILGRLTDIFTILGGQPASGVAGVSAGSAVGSGVNMSGSGMAYKNQQASVDSQFQRLTGKSFQDYQLLKQTNPEAAIALIKAANERLQGENDAAKKLTESAAKNLVESRTLAEIMKERKDQAASDLHNAVTVANPQQMQSAQETLDRIRAGDGDTILNASQLSEKARTEAAAATASELQVLREREKNGFFESMEYQTRLSEKFELDRRTQHQQTVDDIKKLEDELKHVNDNNAEDYKKVWLEANLEVAKAHKKGVEDQIKASVELQNKTVYDADIVRGKIMTDMARSTKDINTIIADAYTGTINATVDALGKSLDKITAKMGPFGSVLKEMLMNMERLFLNRLFMRMMDKFMPAGGSGSAGSSSGSAGGGSGNGGFGGGTGRGSWSEIVPNFLNLGNQGGGAGGARQPWDERIPIGPGGLSQTLGSIPLLGKFFKPSNGGSGGGPSGDGWGAMLSNPDFFNPEGGVVDLPHSGRVPGSDLTGGIPSSIAGKAAGAMTMGAGLGLGIGESFLNPGGKAGMVSGGLMQAGMLAGGPTNPIGIALIAGAFGLDLGMKLFGGGGIDKKIHDAIQADPQYLIDIKDNKTLDQIKQVGETIYGKNGINGNIPGLIHLPEITQMIAAYGKSTGQMNSPVVQAMELTNPGAAQNMSIRAPGREFGGPVMGGMPYLVGERRPELFVPNTSGRIIPTVGNLGGGGGGGMSSAEAAVLTSALNAFSKTVKSIKMGDAIMAHPEAVTSAVLNGLSRNADSVGQLNYASGAVGR